MKLRVVQYWAKHPETGERVDLKYRLQQLDDDRWVDVPIFDMEVRIEDREDESQGV
jgi:LEA14-like dessication related protein